MTNKDVANRLRAARKRFSDKSVRRITEDMDWSYDTYISHEGGRRGISRSQIDKYAKAYGVAPNWLLTGMGPGLPLEERSKGAMIQTTQGLPIIGNVQGGAFMEAEPVPDDDVKFAPVAIDDRYSGFDQYLLKVRGPSMNIDFAEGSFAHCVHIDYHPSELMPRSGSNVIVERRRAGLVEITIKEVVRTDAGEYELWPRSHDPMWQLPIRLDGDEGLDEIKITALVVGCYRRL